MSLADIVIVAGCFAATVAGFCWQVRRARRQPPHYPFDGSNL